MFNRFLTKFNKFSPYSAKIVNESLIISKNESSKIDSKKMINLFEKSLYIGGTIGSVVGFHLGAKNAAKNTATQYHDRNHDINQNKFAILLVGIMSGCGGGIVGMLYPLTVPLYLITSAYHKKYD